MVVAIQLVYNKTMDNNSSHLISFRENCEQALRAAENKNEDKIEKHLKAAYEAMQVASVEYKRKSEFGAIMEMQGMISDTIRKCKEILVVVHSSSFKK